MAEKSRIEQILKYGLGEISTLPPNLSRIEELLVALIEQGGSGEGGTTNYNALTNKPSIEGTTLQGDVSLSQLGAQQRLTFDTAPTAGSDNPVTSNGLWVALQGKASVDSIPDMTDYYNKTQTDNAIILKLAEIIADAPEDFDTLKEISIWISSHEDSAAAMNSAIQENTRKIENKVDKVAGKGLSTNDYTTAEKNKLAGLVDFFTQGTSIPENSDLDEYKTPGVYFVWQKPTADTLANCPVSSAFRMEVACLHLSNRYVQRIYAVNFPEKFFMRYTNDATTWQKWYQFSGTAVS